MTQQIVTHHPSLRSVQSDMVDQNILNFLPEREHGEVYKLLSSHMLMNDPIASDYLDSEYPSARHTCLEHRAMSAPSW